METTQVLTTPHLKVRPWKSPKKKKTSEPNVHFLETILNFQVVTHFSLEKWTSSGRWEISPLLNISSAGRAAITVHGSQRIAVDPNAHQFLPPGPGWWLLSRGCLPEERGTSRWQNQDEPFFSEEGWCCCFFWGVGDFRIRTQRKSAMFVHSLRRKIFKQPRGVEVFYCSGPTSPWEWGKVYPNLFLGGEVIQEIFIRKMRDLDHGTVDGWNPAPPGMYETL